MADTKFSQFPSVADPAGGEVVGLSGGVNARFSSSVFATSAALNTKVTALGNRAANEAVLIICLGDSNIQSFNTANPAVQTANTSVFVRASDGIAPNQNPATDLTWRNVDPNDTAVADNPGFPNVYWGMIRGSHGTADWALADKLQKELNAPVYLVSVSCNSTTSAYWLPVGGAGMDSLELYLTAAINSISPPPGWVAPTKAHVVLWSEGANDVTGGIVGAAAIVAPQAFVNNMKTIRDFMITSGWASKNTLLLNMNMATVFPANLVNNWPGINYLDNQSDEYFRVLSSRNKAVEADNVHFTPVGLNDFGLNAAEIALKGLQPKTYTAQGSNNYEYSGLGVYSYTSSTPNLGTVADVTAPAYLDITQNHTWTGNNGVASTGLNLPAAILYGGTQTIADNATPIGTGAILSNRVVFTNPQGVAKNYGPYPALLSNVVYQANGAQFNASGNITDIVLGPAFSAPNGGSMTASTIGIDLRTNFGSGTVGINQGLIAISNRTAIQVSSASRNADTGSGSILPTIAVQYGILINSMIGATSNIGLVLGTGSITAGNWALQQVDALPSKFNGALNTKIVTSAATTLTLTDADNSIYCTAATAATISLPTPTAALTGRVYLIMNSALTGAEGNVTINVVGGGASIDTGVATLQTSFAIAAGLTRRLQCTGTVWVAI